MLFAETGLSPAQISSLFIIWSATTFVFEVPSGVLADLFSRRRLLVAAPLLSGAGFALWTFFPSYLSFAAGFLLWGAGSSLRSGALQALVYEELARIGAAGSYARLIGRAEAFGRTAELASAAVAAPVLAAGGYRAAGIASVAVCVLGSLAGRLLPESRNGGTGPGEEEDDDENDLGFVHVLREGLAEVRGSVPVRRTVLLVSVLMGAGSVDEYIPLLAEATGVGRATVPLLVLLVSVGAAVGGWLTGRGARRLASALVVAAGCLAAGSASGRPEGFVPVAVAFGIFYWAMAVADARLQDQISDRSRATVTSMAGFGAEVLAVLAFASYALGSLWAGPGILMALFAIPFVAAAVAIRR